MDHRARILAAIHHQPVDRVPTDMWATPEVLERLRGQLGIDSTASSPLETRLRVLDELDIDAICEICPPYIGPPLPDPCDGGHFYLMQAWGMRLRPQAYQGGIYWEVCHHPLAEAETIADLKAFCWPDPKWYDYSALPQLAAQCGGRAVACGYASVFYYHSLLRGLEASLMDPLLRPEFTRYLIQRISDFSTEYHQRCFEGGRGCIDITQVTDDFGSQRGLLVSSGTFDAFYRDPIQRAIELAKGHGVLVFHHDDGDMRELLPTLVRMGIDVLNPVQWRSGDWDLRALKAEYGWRLCFHGGVDNQQTLPFGTPGDVEAEVRHLISTMASDGTGFILAPCHAIQANTPTANILALYEAAGRYGVLASGYASV